METLWILMALECDFNSYIQSMRIEDTSEKILDRHIIDGKSQRHFYHVTSKEIISAIPRVMQIHQAISSLGGISYSRSSCYCEAGSSCSHSEEPQSFKYPVVYPFICYEIFLQHNFYCYISICFSSCSSRFIRISIGGGFFSVV